MSSTAQRIYGPAPRILLSAGQSFGRLTVIDPQVRNSAGRRAAICQCACGNIATIAVSHLTRVPGGTQSCGCIQREATQRIGQVTSHGLARHPLYDTWFGIIKRCERPGHKFYRNYGGRGIAVCPEWHDVAVFIAWVEANLGARPDGCTIDRIDNEGNYEPGNIRWATRKQQRANSRR